MLLPWPVFLLISLATSHDVYERIDDPSTNATTLHPVISKNHTSDRLETKPRNTTGGSKPDQENSLDASVWKIYAAFSDAKKEDSLTSNNTETKGHKDITQTEGTNGTFKPSPLVEEYSDFDSQEQSSKGGYGYLPPPPIKKPPSKFKSATPFEYDLPFEHYKKYEYPKVPQKFPYKYESPIYLKSKSTWRPGGPTAVESQLPTAIVPAGGYYGFPDTFKEAPVYIENPEEFRTYGEYGPHSLNHHREIPWGKLLHLMTALVPVSLLISALTPHIITIENMTPEAPTAAPSVGIRYPSRNRRSQRQDNSDDNAVINTSSKHPSEPASSMVPATPSDPSTGAAQPFTRLPQFMPQAPNLSERCRRRLLCELYSEQHYSKNQEWESPHDTSDCAIYRCKDPRVVSKLISWLLAPNHPIPTQIHQT